MMYGGELGDRREIRDWIEGQGRQHGRIRRMGLIIAQRQRIHVEKIASCSQTQNMRATGGACPDLQQVRRDGIRDITQKEGGDPGVTVVPNSLYPETAPGQVSREVGDPRKVGRGSNGRIDRGGPNSRVEEASRGDHRKGSPSRDAQPCFRAAHALVTDIDVSIDAQRPAGTHSDHVGGGGVCAA